MNGKPCCTPVQDSNPYTAPDSGPTGTEYPHVASSEGRLPREDFRQIPHGPFRMGSSGPEIWPGDGEDPVREVEQDTFHISAFTVTNAQFGAFVEATGYRTDAENFGSSFVFTPNIDSKANAGRDVRQVPDLEWWSEVKKASWKRPCGGKSTLKGMERHPVVHVSYRDAGAFCTWSGTRLPSEAEWEKAARGGLEGMLYPWGNELEPGGKARCNIFRGNSFPDQPRAGKRPFTCPVDRYPPNGFGLFNCSGNVWEWVDSAPGTSSSEPQHLQKGGSYLCHHSYCDRYRLSARTRGPDENATCHAGFRVVLEKA